jgi:thiamine-monophosphate kinase
MKINEIGGEFALIDRLSHRSLTSHPHLVMGIGDDAAVISEVFSNGDYQLVTTDMLVEKSHFRCDWASAEQIGVKSVSCNASDIAAMGGTPTFMFVSLALTPDTDVEWVDALYRGMSETCRRHDIAIAGGDTTHGRIITISITLLGRVSPGNLCLRSHARPGELLCVTGPLGGSAAGLAMLTRGFPLTEYLKRKHFTPQCRLDVSPLIAPEASAMIDISDGLAAEVNHICDQSGTGVEIVLTDIPIHSSVVDAARAMGKEPHAFALSGGEDFELLVSVSSQGKKKLEKKGVPLIPVGRITEPSAGRILRLPNGQKRPLSGGYNHFG